MADTLSPAPVVVERPMEGGATPRRAAPVLAPLPPAAEEGAESRRSPRRTRMYAAIGAAVSVLAVTGVWSAAGAGPAAAVAGGTAVAAGGAVAARRIMRQRAERLKAQAEAQEKAAATKKTAAAGKVDPTKKTAAKTAAAKAPGATAGRPGSGPRGTGAHRPQAGGGRRLGLGGGGSRGAAGGRGAGSASGGRPRSPMARAAQKARQLAERVRHPRGGGPSAQRRAATGGTGRRPGASSHRPGVGRTGGRSGTRPGAGRSSGGGARRSAGGRAGGSSGGRRPAGASGDKRDKRRKDRGDRKAPPQTGGWPGVGWKIYQHRTARADKRRKEMEQRAAEEAEKASRRAAYDAAGMAGAGPGRTSAEERRSRARERFFVAPGVDDIADPPAGHRRGTYNGPRRATAERMDRWADGSPVHPPTSRPHRPGLGRVIDAESTPSAPPPPPPNRPPHAPPPPRRLGSGSRAAPNPGAVQLHGSSPSASGGARAMGTIYSIRDDFDPRVERAVAALRASAAELQRLAWDFSESPLRALVEPAAAARAAADRLADSVGGFKGLARKAHPAGFEIAESDDPHKRAWTN